MYIRVEFRLVESESRIESSGNMHFSQAPSDPIADLNFLTISRPQKYLSTIRNCPQKGVVWLTSYLSNHETRHKIYISDFLQLKPVFFHGKMEKKNL